MTMINISECDLQSSEVLIKWKYVDGPVVTLTDDIQIFSTLSDMSKILGELEPIREISMENDSVCLRNFFDLRTRKVWHWTQQKAAYRKTSELYRSRF